MSRPDSAGDAPSTPDAADRLQYSVALCTYNGARYVAAQLRSIVDASPPCAEIVLVDDASGDDTVDVVRDTLSRWNGRLVVSINPVNVGSLRSFERALGLTTQPLIFLADQDDLWHVDKPARMLALFEARPDLLLLHTDARLVDDAGQPLGHTLFRAIEATTTELAAIHRGDAFDAFVGATSPPGPRFALRRSLLEQALPIPDGWVHDEWLAALASAIGVVECLEAPLIDYRQHATNQIGARKLSFGAKVARSFARPGDDYRRQMARAQALLERLTTLAPPPRADRLEKMRAKLVHLQRRATLPRGRIARILPIARELVNGDYGRYATGFKSVVRDLLHSA